MGALSTLTYAVLQRAPHKLLKYVQCNTMLEKTTYSRWEDFKLYLDGKTVGKRRIYSLLLMAEIFLCCKKKKKKTCWYENAAVRQNNHSLSYLRHARVHLCTKARSRLETPAFEAINLCKSDSSNISLFRWTEGAPQQTCMHTISLSLSMTLITWSFGKQGMQVNKRGIE